MKWSRKRKGDLLEGGQINEEKGGETRHKDKAKQQRKFEEW